MFLTPSKFQDFLCKSNHIDDIYNALYDDDLSNVVISALEVLKKTQQLPYVSKKQKDGKSSTEERKKGNIAFEMGNLQLALLCYNHAILLAPNNSQELKLAFSNRSAIFQKWKLYEACLQDIDICFSKGCPADIVDKLQKRRKEVVCLAPNNEVKYFLNNLSKKYTECASSNLEIPCASSDIKVASTDVPIIVASRDIKVGSVLATETSYVSYTNATNTLFCCHYCQKPSLNLILCEGCVNALFCNEECKSKCIKEYHKYECLILHIICEICNGPLPNLMIKAVLKMRQNCKTWRELIDASYNMGLDRMSSSSVKDIFDADCIFSILSQNDNRRFIYGIKYDASFVCATLLHYLGEIPSFFPKDIDEKKQATHALGRIMMFLSLHIAYNKIYIPIENQGTDTYKYFNITNYGYFSMIGKLNNSCTPNTIALYNNNKISLIALEPIKSGDELSISYQLHRINSHEKRHEQNVNHFLSHGKVCSCNICMGKLLPQELSKSQQKMFNGLNLTEMDKHFKLENISAIYGKILEALEQLKNVPHSREYREIFKRFLRCKYIFENLLSPENIVIPEFLY